MLKLNKITTLAVATVAMFATTSCSDFLDKEPDERVNIQSEDQLLSWIITGYNTSNYGWICELSSDNMIDNNCPHLPASEKDAQKESYYNLPAFNRMDDEIFSFDAVRSETGTDSPSEIWSSMYSAIATANHILVEVDKLSKTNGMTAKLKAVRAEALLIRAYHHFLLVNIFSKAYKNDEASSHDIGIPYITEPENKVYVHADRGNVTQVYDKIQEDLEEGLADIVDTYMEKPKWRFNPNAAHAFAARFYLYRRNYEKVIEHANAVLGAERSANLLNWLMSYEKFDNCTSSKDYSLAWQGAGINNNLMLMSTYSLSWRRFMGNRYAVNSIPLRSINYRSGPTWHWTINCAGVTSGATFYAGNADYGFGWAKVCESFEYTDKVAGIGYAHVIRREFTANSLLLERAEAELMLGHTDNCFEDLYWYEEGRQNFSPETKTKYLSGGNGIESLTQNMIQSWYTKKTNLNCDLDWSSTQRMSADYIIKPEWEPYMNCINDMRRWETSYEGLRFFDLKRWGIEYSHFIGLDKQEHRLTWNDDRRAIEVPQEVIAAGLESSRPVVTSRGVSASQASSLMSPIK